MLLAFPHVFIDARGTYEYRAGALFALPVELCDRFRISKYAALTAPGWHRSEFGYMAFVQEDDLGNRYVLPALYLTDATSPPSKKFPDHKPKFSKAQVEDYLKRHLGWESEIRKKSELELTALVHDLRHLSTSIYHSALEAEKAITASDRLKSFEDIRTVIASQTMLRVRIDYLDFANSVDRFVDQELIPVYSRVDKVIRCFRASARHKNIEIQLSGQSYRLARGPNILDIVPYTLVENAVKYAPKGSEIAVRVSDTHDSTFVAVTSFGPVLEGDESQSIFRRGFRGVNAIRYRGGGTGLGLAVANSVVNVFKGTISVRQEPERHMIGGTAFARTHFEFSIPTAGEDVNRKARFNQRSAAGGRRGRGLGRA